MLGLDWSDVTVNLLDGSQRGAENVARNPQGLVPTIEVEGVRHQLRTGTTIVGRGSDADIRLSDSAASRQHLQLIWDGKAGIARDLGSTNGTKINGQRFREAALSPDTVITIGQTPLRFQLVPSRGAGQRTRQQASHPRPQGSDNSNQAAQPGIDQDFWRGL